MPFLGYFSSIKSCPGAFLDRSSYFFWPEALHRGFILLFNSCFHICDSTSLGWKTVSKRSAKILTVMYQWSKFNSYYLVGKINIFRINEKIISLQIMLSLLVARNESVHGPILQTKWRIIIYSLIRLIKRYGMMLSFFVSRERFMYQFDTDFNSNLFSRRISVASLGQIGTLRGNRRKVLFTM